MSVNTVEDLFNQSLNASELSAKQKAVLEASLNLFARQGFARTSTSDIARAAGVSEGTVYKRFKTKDDILQAILAPFVQQVVPQVAGEFVAATMSDIPDQFETLLRRILMDRIDFVLKNYKIVRILLGEALQRPEIVNDLKDVLTQLGTEKFIPIIHHYQAAQQLIDWDPYQIVRLIFGTVLGEILPQILSGQVTVTQTPEIVARVVTFLMKGLAPVAK